MFELYQDLGRGKDGDSNGNTYQRYSKGTEMATVKYVISTLGAPFEPLAFKYELDGNDFAKGTISFGGYSRNLHIGRNKT
jgi:hypothetical protein